MRQINPIDNLWHIAQLVRTICFIEQILCHLALSQHKFSTTASQTSKSDTISEKPSE